MSWRLKHILGNSFIHNVFIVLVNNGTYVEVLLVKNRKEFSAKMQFADTAFFRGFAGVTMGFDVKS